MLHEKRHGPRQFSADRYSLEKPTTRKDERGRDSNHCIGREHPHDNSWDGHEDDGPGQCFPPPYGVADMAEQQCSQGTGEKSNCEHTEGGEQRYEGLL